jgi:HSP20 family protein
MKPQTGLASTGSTVILTMPENPSSIERSVREIYDHVANRAYQLYEQRGYSHGRHHDDWLQAELELFQPAPVEIQNEDDKFIVQAQVPGFSAKQIDVRVEPGRVLIRGFADEQSKRKTEKTIYSEVHSHQLFRIVNLPGEINPEKATASLEEGTLYVTLPKATTAKAARIEVKSAAA